MSAFAIQIVFGSARLTQVYRCSETVTPDGRVSGEVESNILTILSASWLLYLATRHPHEVQGDPREI